MMNYKPPKFQIVRSIGTLMQGKTADGITVHRQDTVRVTDPDGHNDRMVACCPYDDHFVFIDPNWKKFPGRWFAYCSCGSPAVIVGSNAYVKDGSPSTDGSIKGEMLLCMQHAQTGQHFPVNWGERDKNK